MTRTNTPPRWAEMILVRFLQEKDRETIAGDLLEEYQDAIHAGTKRFRADCRYARQTLSILSITLLTARHLLLAACVVSIVASANLVHISNAPEARPLATAFVLQCIATIAMLNKPRRLPRFVTQFGCVVIVWGGTVALAELAWAEFDPKLAATGIAFVLQGLLTLALHVGWFGGFPHHGR